MKNKFFTKVRPLTFPKIDLKGVKGVLIDLDNTLYPFADAHEKALHKVYLYFYKERPMTEDEFMEFYKRFWTEAFERLGEVPSSHHRMMLFQHIAEFLNIKYPFLIGEKAHNIYFRTVYRSIKPDKKALAFLRKCKRHKIPVCLVTDLFAMIQIEKLRSLKMEKYIHFIVSNDETGHDKPHESMFQTALLKLDMTPEQVIMIGDNEQRDLAGAEKLGIKTYRVIVNNACQAK